MTVGAAGDTLAVGAVGDATEEAAALGGSPASASAAAAVTAKISLRYRQRIRK